MPCWDTGWFTSARRVAAWDQLPTETQGTPNAILSRSTQETERPGPGRWLRHTAHLGQCSCQASARLSCSDWERHKMHIQPSLCPCRVPKNLDLRGLDLQRTRNTGPTLDSALQSTLETEQCRPGRHTPLWAGQTQCGLYTASTPHTHHNICLQFSSPQQHNWTSEPK